MWKFGLGLALVLALVLTVWLMAGRRIAQFAGQLLPGWPVGLAVGPVRYDGGGLLIGGVGLTFGGRDNLRAAVEILQTHRGNVAIADGPSQFEFGPRTSALDAGGRPDVDFSREPGDEVTLNTRTSLLSWPVPFEFHVLGPRSPWWRRYVTYELVWRKADGTMLRMRWLYEQQYLSAGGWTKPQMLWNYHTGLLSTEIYPDSLIEQYIRRTKGWPRADYRIERRGGGVFVVVHGEDMRARHPGGGKSVQVFLDPESHQVTKEIALQ